MSDSEDRLSRIEALVESNSKAIQKLSIGIDEMRHDRQDMYKLMSDLTHKVANLYDAQAKSYETIINLDKRQDQLTDQQQQLIEVIKKMN